MMSSASIDRDLHRIFIALVCLVLALVVVSPAPAAAAFLCGFQELGEFPTMDVVFDEGIVIERSGEDILVDGSLCRDPSFGAPNPTATTTRIIEMHDNTGGG
jgi:hypothetical protein